jgi:hypothetical protein
VSLAKEEAHAPHNKGRIYSILHTIYKFSYNSTPQYENKETKIGGRKTTIYAQSLENV